MLVELFDRMCTPVLTISIVSRTGVKDVMTELETLGALVTLAHQTKNFATQISSLALLIKLLDLGDDGLFPFLELARTFVCTLNQRIVAKFSQSHAGR